MVSTDIAGDLTDNELFAEAQRAEQIFNGTINLPFSSTTPSAKWNIEVSVQDETPFTDKRQFLTVQRRLQGSWRDYISEQEWEKIRWRYCINDECPSIPLINLFPHHKLGVILLATPFRDSVIYDKRKLSDLGYIPAVFEHTDDIPYNEDIAHLLPEFDLLEIVRAKRLPTKAIDKRVYQILETLNNSLSLGSAGVRDIKYNFVIYRTSEKDPEKEYDDLKLWLMKKIKSLN